MKKRGVGMPNSILISILAASFFIIIAIIVGKALYGAFATDDKKCQNYMEWEKFNTAFENLESNSIEETIFFYNENCNIVSFSPKINLEVPKPIMVLLLKELNKING